MVNDHTYKKFLIVFLFIFLLTPFYVINSRAQQIKNHYGLKAGLNFSGFRRTPDFKFSYQVGIAGKRYLGDLGWFVQPEINYSREGNIDQPLEFINVPVIFGFDFSENFNMHLGMQAGFLAGTQGKETADYKSVNVVANLGLEFYLFEISGFGARFDYGLSGFEKADTNVITYTFEVYFIVWVW